MIWVGFNKKKKEEIKPIKNTWYEWLISNIPEPITQIVGGFKDKVISLFKTYTKLKLKLTTLEILLY